MRGVFVTGTDTGVGKTVLAAALVAALRERGVSVGALKPVLTGLADPPDPRWPPDHELLARVSDSEPSQLVAAAYDPPVSPHLAAQLAGRPVDRPAVLGHIERAAGACDALVVEGVGGLMVPLGDGYDVRALALDLGLPLVLAARPGLGTINHTLLTLEAARAVGLTVAAVVLTPWRKQPDQIERSNRETIEELGEVEVAVLPEVPAPERSLLALAGGPLPVERWLGAGTGAESTLASLTSQP